MKLAKLGYGLSAIVLSLSLMPSTSWSSRAYAPAITGTITAAPASGSIEVDRHTYHVKANSAAAKVLGTLHLGDVVDMIIDGPANAPNPEVISIMRHAGS
jgi:hypothetical protein